MSKENNALTNDILIAETLIRVKTLEKLLIDKGIFTREEFQSLLQTVMDTVALSILQKSNSEVSS